MGRHHDDSRPRFLVLPEEPPRFPRPAPPASAIREMPPGSATGDADPGRLRTAIRTGLHGHRQSGPADLGAAAMRFIGAVLGCVILAATPLAQAEDHAAEMETIKRQFCDYQREDWRISGETATEHDEGLVATWMNALTPAGSWDDVDYANPQITKWPAMGHIARINGLCAVYLSPSCKLYRSPGLSTAIHRALDHWLSRDYKNDSNWWCDQIGVPRALAITLLHMDAELTEPERSAGVRILSRADVDGLSPDKRGGYGGQNRVWRAGITLASGLLTRDFALVQRMRDIIFEEVPGSALQPDFSYQMHGPQLQFGNYGLNFAGDMVQWMTALRGTSLAAPAKKADIIRDYLLKGLGVVLWDGSMDISCCGRQIAPDSPRKKGATLLRLLSWAARADADHAAEYQAIIERNGDGAAAKTLPSINSYFWCSDYMVHRRPGYFISTRMNSSRVLPPETGLGENLLGRLLADGATFVYQDGHEYENIFPVWDWARIPGTTGQSTTDRKKLKPRNNEKMSSDFVGGVSDGRYGAAAMDFRRDGLEARKSWFYFDDQVACLGAGISCDSEDVVSTSANQCLAHGDCLVSRGDGPTGASRGLREYSDLKWVYHDHVGYVFPGIQKVTCGIQEQAGTWKDLYNIASPDRVAKDVFSVWIDHGVRPRHASYGYLILLGASPQELQAQADRPDIRILSNTAELQAVRNDKLQITQAVFYRPAALAYAEGRSVSVDRPCLLLLQESLDRAVVSDPTYSLKDLTVTLNGAAKTYRLPARPNAGSSAFPP
jgi:chondroitin AC lyase